MELETQIQTYVNKLLEDLRMQNAPAGDQQKAVEMVTDRLHEVVFHTLVRNLSVDRQSELLEAMKKDKNVEEVLMRFSAEIPDFAQILEIELIKEYEFIKTMMQEEPKK